jgi:mRNA interferase MazF
VTRGDIWMYRFAPPDKRRPVLVLSRDKALEYLRTATIAPISTKAHGVASEVRVGIDGGLKTESVVNLDHIATVPQVELRTFLGHLDERRMRSVCAAIEIALGCE